MLSFDSKMSYKRFVDEETKLIFQRWLYTFVGILTMIPIILLTLGQIQIMKRDNNEFAFYLLILIHSGCMILSMILTALFCRFTDAFLTSLTIILLSIYTGLHFYIRFLLDYDHLKDDFSIISLRLGFVLIMLIILLPWTNIMVHSYRINDIQETICSRKAIFSWFLNFDSMLMISLLTLNIRSQTDFGRPQLLILSIGIPLVFLWLIIGKLLSNNKSRHWIVWILFYILSFVQITHLAYITYWSKYEYNLLLKTNERNLILLLILTFICGSTNILIHFLTIVISLGLFRK